jgi:hypothetical protein
MDIRVNCGDPREWGWRKNTPRSGEWGRKWEIFLTAGQRVVKYLPVNFCSVDIPNSPNTYLFFFYLKPPNKWFSQERGKNQKHARLIQRQMEVPRNFGILFGWQQRGACGESATTLSLGERWLIYLL